MDEQNSKINDIVFFNADGENVYGDSQDGIDASIAKMHDIVDKVLKKSPYVACMYSDGWGMNRSLAYRCPTFQELNFSDKTSVTLYKIGEYETGNTFYFNGQPTQMPKLFIKKKNAAFDIDNNGETSDYANKNLVCLDDIKTEYTPKIITLVFNDMSIDETYINRTFIFKVDSQIEDAPDFYEDEELGRKYDYCTFDRISTSTDTDNDYTSWSSVNSELAQLAQLVQPVELVSYTNMGNPRILTVKLNYGNTLHVYFNGVDLYKEFNIMDDGDNLISFNVNNHSYYKQYSYKIKGGDRTYIKVTENFDIQLNNIYDDMSIDIYGHYKDTCDIKINTVGDCSVYDTYEQQTITEYIADDDYSEEHYYQTFTNIMSPGYNYYTHKTHYNACDVSYDSSNKPICKIGQTFYVSVDKNVYNKFYWKFTGIKTEADGTKTHVEFDSIDYAMNAYEISKEDVLLNELNKILLQSDATVEEFKTIRMKDNDYYGFFVPMDLKQHYINVDPSNPMTVDSSNPMYPLNDFSIRNLYIEVTEIYKPKTVTFYIYDDMDVEMFNGELDYIYNKSIDNKEKKFPYKKEIQTNDVDYYINDKKYNGDNMNITCRNATDDNNKGWYFITDNNKGNKSAVRNLGAYAMIDAYDNMSVHLSLSKSVVISMYITADSGVSVVDINRPTNVVPTDGVNVYTIDAPQDSLDAAQAHFAVSSSDTTYNVITVEKHFFYIKDGEVKEDLTEILSEQVSILNGTIHYYNMRTDGYYKISFRKTIRYERKRANVKVMYSDGDNIIPKINGDGTVNFAIKDGYSEFTFMELPSTTNTYTLSLIHSDETIKKTYPSATVSYNQRITETDTVNWINASDMTSDNSYTVRIGGNDAFGRAKLLDILINPTKIITYSVKIVNTGQLCEVFFWDYVNSAYTSLGDNLNITFSTSLDNPNKFKVKFVVKDKYKETYKFYSLLYVSPSGLIEHQSNNNKFNANGYVEYEDLFVAINDYKLTITPINDNILYLTFPNDSTVNALKVTTTASNVSNGSNDSIVYKKYTLGNDKEVTFRIDGLLESVTSVNLYMYGSDTDNINADNVWIKSPNKKVCSVVNGSVSFDYKYKYGWFYNDDGSVGTLDMIYKYYRIDVQPISQSDYVFEVNTEKTKPCPGLRNNAWIIYITKTAPSGIKTSISSSDISLGENPTFELNDTLTVDTTNHSNFSDYFYAVGGIFKVGNGEICVILAPKLNLDEFLVGTYSRGLKRYLKEGDVIKNLIKINAKDDNYSSSNIYVDCKIGLVVILEWASTTKYEMTKGNGVITVNAPWNNTSEKLLYFNCKDTNDNILDVNVDDNFVDESSSFTESDILKTPTSKRTHTLTLKSKSFVSVGEYKIGIKYNTYKQITAMIQIGSAVSNIRYWPYTVDTVAVPPGDGYILSTAKSISLGSTDLAQYGANSDGKDWLPVSYVANSDTPYTFMGNVYNENGESYTSISDEPTSETNLQWGSRLYVLKYLSDDSEYLAIDNIGFAFASSWNDLDTEQK